MDWLKCAIKFHVGDHPKAGWPHEKIYIEAVEQEDETYKWAVRWSSSALTNPKSNGTMHFLIERDFRGEDKKLVRFDTKEEALEAYNQWEAQGEDNDS